MHHFIIEVPSGPLSTAILSHLEKMGITPSYTMEGISFEVGLFAPTVPPLPPYAKVRQESTEIDWNAQWATHALSPTGFSLLPGGGFGDLSHPTTRLILDLLPSYVQGAHVVDIGCGSGVLSLAAAANGARSVYGYDIDTAAIAHARANVAHNNFPITIGATPIPSVEGALILMNMISSEQKIAENGFSHRNNVWIVSGILEEDRDRYLVGKKWQLLEERKSEGWIAFAFQE